MTKTVLRELRGTRDQLEALQGEDNSKKPAMYTNLLNSASDEVSMFITYLEDNTGAVLSHPFFNDELAAWVEKNAFDKERIYTASFDREEHGDYTLHITSELEDDGTNLLEGDYENYIDTDDICEDVLALIGMGFNIQKSWER